jgi:hypothetical protein
MGRWGCSHGTVATVVVVTALSIALSPACVECANDADCPERRCVDGTCAAAAPADVPATSCADDAACPAGDRCVDGACVVVPSCLLLNATFDAVFTPVGGPPQTGTLAASTDPSSCRIAFAPAFADAPLATMTADGVGPDGALLVPVGFNSGRWDVVGVVGELAVVGGTIAFGTRDYGCVVDDDCAAQLVGVCRGGCDAGCVGECLDGLCSPAVRGTCQ